MKVLLPKLMLQLLRKSDKEFASFSDQFIDFGSICLKYLILKKISEALAVSIFLY